MKKNKKSEKILKKVLTKNKIEDKMETTKTNNNSKNEDLIKFGKRSGKNEFSKKKSKS